MHSMTQQGKALREAEELANMLQQHRGTSSTRWMWQRGQYTLGLYPRVPVTEDTDDMIACGEVLHLVRMSLVDDGWNVRTTRLPGGAAVAVLEIEGQRAVDHHDELLRAILGDPRERGFSTPAVDANVAKILLHDAAVEHGVRLTTLTSGDLAASGVRVSCGSGSTWRTVAPRTGPASAPVVMAVLTTSDNGTDAQLRAGEASADIQLTAASAGLRTIALGELESSEVLDSPALPEGHTQRVFRVVPASEVGRTVPQPRQPHEAATVPRQRVAV